MVDNLANAIVIVGGSYLALAHGMNPLVWLLMMVGAVFTWQGTADESKEYLTAQTEYYKAKTRAIEAGGKNAKKN